MKSRKASRLSKHRYRVKARISSKKVWRVGRLARSKRYLFREVGRGGEHIVATKRRPGGGGVAGLGTDCRIVMGSVHVKQGFVIHDTKSLM